VGVVDDGPGAAAEVSLVASFLALFFAFARLHQEEKRPRGQSKARDPEDADERQR
jgi:hypothetical protein